MIHFIASWFCIYGFRVVGNLYDHSFMFDENILQNSIIFKERFNADLNVINQFGVLGLLIAYITGWVISVKRSWFWANSVIVFLIIFPLYIYNLLAWTKLKNLAFAPGQIIDLGAVPALVIDFIILLGIASIIFFNKGIINYIDRGVKKPKKPSPAQRPSAMALKRQKTSK